MKCWVIETSQSLGQLTYLETEILQKFSENDVSHFRAAYPIKYVTSRIKCVYRLLTCTDNDLFSIDRRNNSWAKLDVIS